MLDSALRRHIDPPLNRLGKHLASLGASANMVTSIGLFLGLVSTILIALGAFIPALIFVLLSRLADGLDGAVARASAKTDFGGLFDISADFLFYGAVPFAFALHDPAANGVPATFLVLSFYFNAATFLGFAILAEKRGMETRAQGEKTLYFSNGLLEGTETIAFFVLLCLAPTWFGPLAWLFGTLCFATAILRLIGGRRVFPH